MIDFGFYKPYARMQLAIAKRKELIAMNRKPTVHENIELAEYNREIESGLYDAERTRTSELLNYHSWRDDINVQDAMDIGRQLDKYRNK